MTKDPELAYLRSQLDARHFDPEQSYLDAQASLGKGDPHYKFAIYWRGEFMFGVTQSGDTQVRPNFERIPEPEATGLRNLLTVALRSLTKQGYSDSLDSLLKDYVDSLMKRDYPDEILAEAKREAAGKATP